MINYIHKKIRKQAFSISALKLNKIFSIECTESQLQAAANPIKKKNDESRLQKENDMRYLWAFFFFFFFVCVYVCAFV